MLSPNNSGKLVRHTNSGLMHSHMSSPANLPFIVSTDRQKVDTKTRKLIRSHVMRGKNRVKSRRKPRDAVHGDKPKEALNLTANRDPIFPLTVPRLPCSELSTLRLPEDVEPVRVADALSLVSMFPRAMYQLNQCITPETAGTTQAWIAPLFFDLAYLYTMCFTVQTFFDGFLGRVRSDKARRRDDMYYAKAIRILQDRLALDDDSVRLSDSTILTVLAMSGHAYTIGDYSSANDHTNGLLQLVSMRGIDDTLLRNTKAMVEIVRSDLCTAIDNGSKPVLFASDNIPWPLMSTSESILLPHKFPSGNSPRYSGITGLPSRLNPELAAIWAAMYEFCSLVNAAARDGGTKISEEAFLNSMGSTLYRLLHQRFVIGSLDEAFRLALLAFSSPIYLHWNRVELPDERFNLAYRGALAALRTQAPNSIEPQVWTWLLTIGALSMSHEPDSIAWLKSWLRTNVLLCNVFTWTQMRDLLGSFLWVGLVYDEEGETIFDSTLLQYQCEATMSDSREDTG